LDTAGPVKARAVTNTIIIAIIVRLHMFTTSLWRQFCVRYQRIPCIFPTHLLGLPASWTANTALVWKSFIEAPEQRFSGHWILHAREFHRYQKTSIFLP